ncbi:MAG TPA: hypothetical protein EYP19_09015 [Desulfobacterales bacterium]|nr:hypothetical protein [Desulfobacterales bacterium]
MAMVLLGMLLSSMVGWILIRSGKRAKRRSHTYQDQDDHCASCGRWVPAHYLRERRYCYACSEKMRGPEKEKTLREKRVRESVRNAITGRAPFPYQAELDRRVFHFLVNEKERDGATMVQALAESDGDKERAKARYFRLRYKQMAEAGELARFMKEILEEKEKLSYGQLARCTDV